MVHISLWYDKRYLDASGAGTVRLMINHHSRTALLDSGVRVKPDQWDKPTKRIVRHPGKVNLNAWLAKLVLRSEDIVRELALSGELAPMTVQDIAAVLRSRLWGDGDVASHPFGDEFRKVVESRRTLNSRAIYAHAGKLVTDFDRGAENRDLSQFSAEWARRFVSWMQERYAPSTVSTAAIKVGYIFRQALARGEIRSNPFAGISVKVPPTRKRSLSREQFRRLWNAATESSPEREALDCFRISFLMLAANPADIAMMTRKNLVNGRVEYTRRKTGRFYSVPIVPELPPLLEIYERGGQLFPPLTAHGKTKETRVSPIDARLRAICEREGLPPVTLYWARHSWASFAAELDIPIEVISTALGHSHGAAVTLVYIAFELNKVDRAHRKVIDYALYDPLDK